MKRSAYCIKHIWLPIIVSLIADLPGCGPAPEPVKTVMRMKLPQDLGPLVAVFWNTDSPDGVVGSCASEGEFYTCSFDQAPSGGEARLLLGQQSCFSPDSGCYWPLQYTMKDDTGTWEATGPKGGSSTAVSVSWTNGAPMTTRSLLFAHPASGMTFVAATDEVGVVEVPDDCTFGSYTVACELPGGLDWNVVQLETLEEANWEAGSQTRIAFSSIDDDGDGSDAPYAGGDDCDDGDPGVNPGALEVCDGIDNDCDGLSDEDLLVTFYEDEDSDGFGDPLDVIEQCSVPDGYVSTAEDCDDTDDSIFPGAVDVCDGVDNDCGGEPDEDLMIKYYYDLDGDGHGDPDASYENCRQIDGFVAAGDDCDDTEPEVSPGANEICNEKDDDCDVQIDEALTTDYYRDADADGYGDDGTRVTACDAPDGYVAVQGDCDDADASVYLGAAPRCNDRDMDCDEKIDNDTDGDKYSAATCGGSDCDDLDGNVYPGTNGSCVLGTSCKNILEGHPATYKRDGSYLIDPDGISSGKAEFEVQCDMTGDGGGFTLISLDLIKAQDWFLTDPSSFVIAYQDAYSECVRDDYTFTIDPEEAESGTLSFALDPGDGLEAEEGVHPVCDVVLRATAVLPFSFSAYFGSWKAGEYLTVDGNGHDDNKGAPDHPVEWGNLDGELSGHLLFGTENDIRKNSNDWPDHASPYGNWNENAVSQSYEYRDFSWDLQTIPASVQLRWEIEDQGQNEGVLFHDVAIWVR